MVEMVEMADIGDTTAAIHKMLGAWPRAHLDHPLRGRKMVEMVKMTVPDGTASRKFAPSCAIQLTPPGHPRRIHVVWASLTCWARRPWTAKDRS